jgi:hypothetical protein
MVKGELVLEEKAFSLRIHFLSPGEFSFYGTEMGIPDKMMRSPEIRELLGGWCFIEVFISNFSETTLVINPSHFYIRDNKEPIGVLVEPGAFFFKDAESSAPLLQTLSHLFDTSSIEVQAGQNLHRVLTFRPLGSVFREQNLTLEIDHLYLGIDDFPQKGRFNFKPCATL